jgi:hypothetical protein
VHVMTRKNLQMMDHYYGVKSKPSRPKVRSKTGKGRERGGEAKALAEKDAAAAVTASSRHRRRVPEQGLARNIAQRSPGRARVRRLLAV